MRKLIYLLTALALSGSVLAARKVRFIVVDPRTNKPVVGASVTILDLKGRHAPQVLNTGLKSSITQGFDLSSWAPSDESDLIKVPLDGSITLQGGQDQMPTR